MFRSRPIQRKRQSKTCFRKSNGRLAGWPDYLLIRKGDCIPVEIKSSMVREPRESDVLQLLTYCLLAEENGYSVSGGRLEYQNRIFDIPYGLEERRKVLDILAEIRNSERLSLNQVSQVNDNRCHGCKYRTICQQEKNFGSERIYCQ